MENLIIVLGIGILGALIFLIYKQLGGKIAPEQENKMLFEYIESLRKEIREGQHETRRETQEKLDKIASLSSFLAIGLLILLVLLI